MKNFIQKGETIEVPAPYDVASGGGVKVGALFGVATTDASTGEPVEISRRGAFYLKKKAATSISLGAKIYWDNTAFEVTPTSTGNLLIGAAIFAAGSADGTVTALLDGAIRA